MIGLEFLVWHMGIGNIYLAIAAIGVRMGIRKVLLAIADFAVCMGIGKVHLAIAAFGVPTLLYLLKTFFCLIGKNTRLYKNTITIANLSSLPMMKVKKFISMIFFQLAPLSSYWKHSNWQRNPKPLRPNPNPSGQNLVNGCSSPHLSE